MQDDVTDGAKWAIAQGIADGKRICIVRRQLRRLRHADGPDQGTGTVQMRRGLVRRDRPQPAVRGPLEL
ncbi:hypothetical protein LP420_24430 [Massilia sp. B-10]|nr:hypothetical protein LP420_24430 [Massilia sp. B-10]